MKRFIILDKIENELYGVTKDSTVIRLKRGDRFKYKEYKFRVGLEGNYFVIIPWWKHFRVLSAVIEFFCGKKDYDA